MENTCELSNSSKWFSDEAGGARAASQLEAALCRTRWLLAQWPLLLSQRPVRYSRDVLAFSGWSKDSNTSHAVRTPMSQWELKQNWKTKIESLLDHIFTGPEMIKSASLAPSKTPRFLSSFSKLRFYSFLTPYLLTPPHRKNKIKGKISAGKPKEK